jgi:transposase-like protein
MTTQFKSLLQVLDFFKDEPTCKAYLAQSRWGGTPCCPHCGNVGAYTTTRGYKCKAKECGKKFTVITGTIFENTKIELRTWYAAMYLCTAHKKGISSLQLHRDLNITQKTAWFLLHRIREMLANNEAEQFSDKVEVDETYIGGKNKNRHANKKVANSQGRSHADKTAVVGIAQKSEYTIIEREHKVIVGRTVKEKVYTKYSSVKLEVVKDTEATTLIPIMLENVQNNSTIVTDAYRSYNGLSANFTHITIKHTDGNYITIGDAHTNTIEGFWKGFKLGIQAIYNAVSPKHLHRYCNEFGFRYNDRLVTDPQRFISTFNQVENVHLTYKNLIGKNGKKDNGAETEAKAN